MYDYVYVVVFQCGFLPLEVVVKLLEIRMKTFRLKEVPVLAHWKIPEEIFT